jgi:hypothetical protein
MRKNVLLSGVLATLLAGAAVSQAAVVVSVMKSGTVGGFDDYLVKITALTGNDNNGGSAGQPRGVITLTGTFTATSGTLSVPGSTAGQISTGLGNGGSQASNNTFVNMDSVSSVTRSPNNATPTSVTANWAVLGGSDFFLSDVDNTPADGFDQTLLAQVAVSTGGAWSFTGQVGTQGQDAANQAPSTLTFSSPAPVPEPAAIGLTGVAAVAALARRRRRA